jgi:YfiR/HmsC-like
MALLTSRAGAFGLVMALGNCLAAGTPEPPIDEYQVKAAFLYNFAKFVQWPAGTFQSPGDALAICVLGEDPFGHSLGDIVAGRTIEGRPLTVRHIASVKEGAACQILFVSSAENKRSPPMLADIKAPGVLTIGESNTPGGDGAIIHLRLDGGKVRFDINVEAAEREKLRISSRLLSLAHITETNRK